MRGFVYGHALLTLHSLWSNMADEGRRTLWRRKLTFTMAILTSLTGSNCRQLHSDFEILFHVVKSVSKRSVQISIEVERCVKSADRYNCLKIIDFIYEAVLDFTKSFDG